MWVVSPSNNNVWTELSSHDLVNELPVFDITLQSESTDLSNSSLSCGAERILVYRGLPDFLPPMGEETGGEGWTSQGLLAVFSGPQIHNLSLTVTTPVMSVVYVRGSGSVGGYRFIVAASPTNSSEEEDGVSHISAWYYFSAIRALYQIFTGVKISLCSRSMLYRE